MDYNDNPKVGLLQKNKVSDIEYFTNSNDVELINVEKDQIQNNYISLDDSNKCKHEVKFQSKPQQAVKPNDNKSEILFSQISVSEQRQESNTIKSVNKQEQPKPQQQNNLIQSQNNQPMTQSQNKVVLCPVCKTQQGINDPQNPFQCFRCRQVVQVSFQLFLCGTCQSKVMYQVGISPLIKCSKCGTNNYVQQPTYQGQFQSQLQNQFQNQMVSQWRIINQQPMIYNSQMVQSTYNQSPVMQSQMKQNPSQQQTNPQNQLNQQNQQIIDLLLEQAKPTQDEEEKQPQPLPPVNPWSNNIQQQQIIQAIRPSPQQQQQSDIVLQNEPTEYIQMLANKKKIQLPQDQL